KKVLEVAGYACYDKVEHVPYGRFSLPDGKISSRRGKQAVLVDLLEYAENKAKDVIANRTFTIEKPEDVISKVAASVLNYSVLKVERGKDCVFDAEKAFSFEGETAPYMQYTYTRLESVLRKYAETDTTPNYTCFDESAFDLVKYINTFKETIALALEKRDASIVAKRVMEMCKQFNKFYTNNKILEENAGNTKAKINLVKSLKETLAVGFYIICIDTLKEM
ncbi:MAG: arginine--tRNA ligase, partial [Clostridia bacterium]|nr:arginine--tRNA ligase [Clostridia bacterium]